MALTPLISLGLTVHTVAPGVAHACCPCVWYKDRHDRYEQTTPFTITSRAEMPNEEFTAEISRATKYV